MPGYDVNIQIVSMDRYNGMKFYDFGQRGSLGVRGIQKLINLWVKYFLTPLGTDPTDLTYGTNVTGLIGSNTVPRDAQDVILLAVDKTNAAVQVMQSGLEISEDERLSTASVTDFILIEDAPGVAAQIYIQNVLGEGLPLLLPTLTVRSS